LLSNYFLSVITTLQRILTNLRQQNCDFTILVANKLKEGKVIAVEPNPNDF